MLALRCIPFYNDSMNQANHLHRLQQIDSQIDQNEARLAEIERLLANDAQINQARQTLEAADKTLHQARQSLKQTEFAVHEQQMKIAQNEASLYGGRIKVPKELQDMQKDIASLKKHLAVLEDQQLEAMLALETAESQEQAAQRELTQAQADFTERSAGWLGQKEQLQRILERFRAERAAAVSQIAPDSLKIYDTLRKRKSGVAVTSIKEGSCAVCGSTIRPSEQQAARAAQDLVYCTSCGRILYAG